VHPCVGWSITFSVYVWFRFHRYKSHAPHSKYIHWERFVQQIYFVELNWIQLFHNTFSARFLSGQFANSALSNCESFIRSNKKCLSSSFYRLWISVWKRLAYIKTLICTQIIWQDGTWGFWISVWKHLTYIRPLSVPLQFDQFVPTYVCSYVYKTICQRLDKVTKPSITSVYVNFVLKVIPIFQCFHTRSRLSTCRQRYKYISKLVTLYNTDPA
jgi:hypothetical protein